MKHLFNKKNAFTLVELIVVITILAILGTIGFISLQGYAIKARDSMRLSDINTISRALEYTFLDNGMYPQTGSGTNITYSGSTLWTQGYFTEAALREARRIAEVPLDPLLNIPYAYSVTYNRSEYQLGGILEQGTPLGLQLIPNTYAAGTAYSIVKGNYNGAIISKEISNVTYIFGVPSILTKDFNFTDLLDLITNNKFILDKYSALLEAFATTQEEIDRVVSFNPPTPNDTILFSGNKADIATSSGLLSIAQNAYEFYNNTGIDSHSDIEEYIALNPYVAENEDAVRSQVATSLLAIDTPRFLAGESKLLSYVQGTTSGSNGGGVSSQFPLLASSFCPVDFSHSHNSVSGFENHKTYANEFSLAALKSDGSIEVWGDPARGGAGEPTGTGFIDIFSNRRSFAALHSDGSITSWGEAIAMSNSPAGNGFSKISSTLQAYAAIASDGSIVTWGDVSMGGTGAPSGTGFVDIYSNRQAFAALKSDGSIVAWGNNSYGANSEPVDSGYVKIFSTQSAFAAIKADGSITAWGDSNTGGSGAPIGSGYSGISSADYAFAALASDGSIVVWGEAPATSNPPAGTGYTKSYSNQLAFAALASDGSIHPWGFGATGGGGAPAGTGYTQIYSTEGAFATLAADGSILAWGSGGVGGTAPGGAGTGYAKIYSNGYAFTALNSNGSVISWGSATYGGGSAPAGNDFVNVFSNRYSFAGLHSDGSISVWGEATQGGSNGPSGTGFVGANGGTWASCY